MGTSALPRCHWRRLQSPSRLRVRSILPFSHLSGQPRKIGIFELVDDRGGISGSIDVSIRWQHAYEVRLPAPFVPPVCCHAFIRLAGAIDK